jgi:anaphase-promoting complex subunit 4
LTWLLTTGRASKPLEDFLGGGEQMSERVGMLIIAGFCWHTQRAMQGIQKWESIMSDALIKLRDYSEKRLVPACQRLQLVLTELQGWRML